MGVWLSGLWRYIICLVGLASATVIFKSWEISRRMEPVKYVRKNSN